MIDPYIERILRAKVYDVAKETELQEAHKLSARLDNQILLKREDMQPVFSFKLRGAYNKIVKLSEQEKAAGVICASAGNHAQGVALSATKLGIQSLIVMPCTTPPIKVDAVKSFGGAVILYGDSYDDACEHAVHLAKTNGMTFIHPFDDPDVIAGQGTIAMEIFRQHPQPIDAIFIPVGGGGLMAGMASYIKFVSPETKIIAVEPEDAPTLAASMEVGRPMPLKEVGIFADGVAVRMIGKETFNTIKDIVDEVILTTTDELCAAVKDIFDDTRSIMEPAGALGVAGIKQYVRKYKIKNQCLVAINSGANMNFDRLRHVAERAEIGERREALLAAEIPEKPGSFLKFGEILGNKNITEFNYRYHDAKSAQIFCGVELTEGDKERKLLIHNLEKQGFNIVDLTDNDTAKIHIRYMVGGHAERALNEVVLSTMFPERPRALMDFLRHIGTDWNISLFHYRNHGAAYGRILVGIQMQDQTEKDALIQKLRNLGYPVKEQTENNAYRLFALGGKEAE